MIFVTLLTSPPPNSELPKTSMRRTQTLFPLYEPGKISLITATLAAVELAQPMG
jgi:hypothetical protein